MKYNSPRGTRDLLPVESAIFRKTIDKILSIFNVFNYQEITTPIFEASGLFERAVGETTDIVEKEMYTFKDKGDRSITLRPEGTASVVRAYLEHLSDFQKQQVAKLVYVGPMFRYERPQTGRYRQFYQLGVEAIGSSSPLLDVETMIMGMHALDILGIKNAEIAINSVGCDVCRPVIREQLKEFVGSIVKNLCTDCQTRYENNPLRILDCKNPKCQTYFMGMPSMSQALCKDCNDHFICVLDQLDENNIPYVVDPNLVRGLDYYTKTVFEIRSSLLGAQNAICGGGRYDNLIGELGGRKTPAFGFAIGLDRLIMVLEQLKLLPETDLDIDVFCIGLETEAENKVFQIMNVLRKNGLKCEYYFKRNSIGDGIKQGLLFKAKFAIILGEEELENKIITLKDLTNKRQSSYDDIEEVIKAIKS
ncbi:MAG: histidine--tRNA ligase [Candidatus Margulisbacteria bacterium]|nr:histidine--tRNA ligase [Candidatus Margulisiibacteriota bacterium]